MRATRILFASINFPVHVEARAVRGPFASTCHFAATVLFRVALLLIFGAGGSCADRAFEQRAEHSPVFPAR